jgi:Domain of unknown function (DUF3127)
MPLALPIARKPQYCGKSTIHSYSIFLIIKGNASFTMSYEVTGRLAAIYNTVQRTETFRTREFVIEKSEDINGRMITNYVKFQAVQDRTAMLDKLNVGDEVKVHFNLKGTKWVKDGRENYITNLDAWRIEQFVPQVTQTNVQPPSDFDPFSMQTTEAASDDLPF